MHPGGGIAPPKGYKYEAQVEFTDHATPANPEGSLAAAAVQEVCKFSGLDDMVFQAAKQVNVSNRHAQQGMTGRTAAVLMQEVGIAAWFMLPALWACDCTYSSFHSRALQATERQVMGAAAGAKDAVRRVARAASSATGHRTVLITRDGRRYTKKCAPCCSNPALLRLRKEHTSARDP